MNKSNKTKKFGLIVKEITTPFYWLLLRKNNDSYWVWRREFGLAKVPGSYFHAEFAAAKLINLPRVFDVMNFIEVEED